MQPGPGNEVDLDERGLAKYLKEFESKFVVFVCDFYQKKDMETVPKELRNLRACLMCSLVKTLEQFEYAGCDNCERVLRLKNNKENILLCTSPNFDGLISVISPEDSWVSRWQRIDSLVKGCYAISVSGKLPGNVIRELKARGITYRSRDRTNLS